MKNLILITVLVLSGNILIAQWQPGNGICGGNISYFVIIDTNILACTYDSAVWKRPLSKISGIHKTTSHDNSLKLYLNQKNGKFSIEPDHKTICSTNIEIYSWQGEKIIEKTDLNQSNFNEKDIPDYPKGAYMVKYFTGEKTYSDKIIIQNVVLHIKKIVK